MATANNNTDHRRQEVQQIVKNACDQLNAEGVDARNYVEQLAWLFFLKAFDETESRKEQEAAFDDKPYERRLPREYPIFVLEVLNALASRGQPGEVSLEAMRGGCDQAYGIVRDRLDALWEDCANSGRDLFRLVNEQSSVPRASVPGIDADVLIERGFVQLSGNKLQRPNRLLARLLSELPNDATAMARLFGTGDAALHLCIELAASLGQDVIPDA